MGFIIYLILFLLSFVFMGLEIAAVRIITPYFGNSVYTWGYIITVFLMGSSVGYWLGGKSADISSHKMWLKRYFICCVSAVALIPHAAKIIMPSLQDHHAILTGSSCRHRDICRGISFVYPA